MYLPFTRYVYTPNCFIKDFGKKQIRFNGFIEMAYLHPEYFNPDPSVIRILGIKPNEKYIIIRFVSWNANHDIGFSGLKEKEKTGHKSVQLSNWVRNRI